MTVTLQTAEGRTSSPIAAPGRVAGDNTFRTSGYPAGKWILAVQAAPLGWTLKTAMAGGKDVSVDPLELSDADAGGVVLTFTDQTTELSGTVMNTRGPDASAEVVVFPADSMAWKEIGVVARRGRSLRVTSAGSFTTSGLPPGEYFVVAIPSSTVSDWQDPLFLNTLVGVSTRVTLGDGEKKAVALKTIQK